MKKIISLSICLLSLVSYSQQTPQRNLYGYNKYAINPAYAGASGCTQINFSHLNQWVKVEGAPLTSMISANGLIGKSLVPLIPLQDSYIKDDWDFIKQLPRKIEYDAELFTCDVVSLYTNISYDLGSTMEYWIREHQDKIPEFQQTIFSPNGEKRYGGGFFRTLCLSLCWVP